MIKGQDILLPNFIVDLLKLRRLLQAAKSADGKAVLNEVRFVEDFTLNDFEIRKKALPLMRKAFEEEKRVRFTKGKLFVDGREVSIM